MQYSKIDNLLEKRAEEYPEQGAVRTKLDSKLSDFVNTIFSKWKKIGGSDIDKEKIKKSNSLIGYPIFIGGNMKSGTTLMLQLLDDHPQIFAMPGDSHYLNNYEEYSSYNFEELAEFWLKRLVIPTPTGAFWFLGKNEENYITFLDYLNYFLDHRPGDHNFLSSVRAVYSANPTASGKEKYWVEKTPKNELKAERLFSEFDNATFINMLRDPLVNISSLKRLSRYRGNDFSAWHEALGQKKLLMKAKKNKISFDKDYFCMKYEELVSDTKKSMKDIANFLGISFEVCMLEPTENGCSTQSKSMYSEDRKKQGEVVDKSSSEKWKEDLSNRDKRYIVSIMGSIPFSLSYKKWGKAEILKHKSWFIFLLFFPLYHLYSLYKELKVKLNV
ncbi:MAG: sulfotransferase [Candidatus Paceibacteria bacterium]